MDRAVCTVIRAGCHPKDDMIPQWLWAVPLENLVMWKNQKSKVGRCRARTDVAKFATKNKLWSSLQEFA